MPVLSLDVTTTNWYNLRNLSGFACAPWTLAHIFPLRHAPNSFENPGSSKTRPWFSGTHCAGKWGLCPFCNIFVRHVISSTNWVWQKWFNVISKVGHEKSCSFHLVLLKPLLCTGWLCTEMFPLRPGQVLRCFLLDPWACTWAVQYTWKCPVQVLLLTIRGEQNFDAITLHLPHRCMKKSAGSWGPNCLWAHPKPFVSS